MYLKVQNISDLEKNSTHNDKKLELIWLEVGIKLLAERGIENLNIDELSSRTGKAKTSFYHFYSSKSNFLERLALYWEHYYSLQYFEKLKDIVDPKERFEKMIEMAHTRMKDEIVWIYFKERGKKYEEIRKIVRRVEQGRLKFLTQIFTDMDYPYHIAKEKSSLFMYLFFGWSMLNTSNDSLEKFKKIVIENILIHR
jgi:AcrR family transcriptional regulator